MRLSSSCLKRAHSRCGAPFLHSTTRDERAARTVLAFLQGTSSTLTRNSEELLSRIKGLEDALLQVFSSVRVRPACLLNLRARKIDLLLSLFRLASSLDLFPSCFANQEKKLRERMQSMLTLETFVES